MSKPTFAKVKLIIPFSPYAKETITVEALSRNGLAIHREILFKWGNDYKFGKKFVVTLIKSGRHIGHSIDRLKDAKKVLLALEPLADWPNLCEEDFQRRFKQDLEFREKVNKIIFPV